MKPTKLLLLGAIALSTLTTCAADAGSAKLKYAGSNTPKQGCLLPAVDSTTVGKRIVDIVCSG